MKNFILGLSVILASPLLNGCSSDSDSTESTSYAHLKFYNGISNSSTLQANVDDSLITHVGFSNGSSIYKLESDIYELTINREDESNEYIEIASTSVSLSEDYLSLLLLTGSVESPTLLEFSYDYTSKEELIVEEDDDIPQFELYVANLSNASGSFDFYIAPEEADFSEATLVSNLSSNSFSNKKIHEQDIYRFIVTEAGSDNIVFETTDVALSYLSTFVVVFRDNVGPSEFAMEIMSEYTFTTTLFDKEADASIQFYQSNKALDATDVYIELPIDSAFVEDLPPRSLSESIDTSNGTYILNTFNSAEPTSPLLENLILELNEGSEKVVVLYQDLNDEHQAMIMSKLGRPLAFENSIALVNLAKDEDSDVKFYFIAEGESISSAGFSSSAIGFAESFNTSLVNKPYQIYATIEDDADGERLIYQSDWIHLETTQNYLLILEEDDTQATGYSLGILENR